MNEQASKKCCGGETVCIKDVPPETPFCWFGGTAEVVAHGFAGGVVIKTDKGVLTTVDEDSPVRLCEKKPVLRPLTAEEMKELVRHNCLLYKSAHEIARVNSVGPDHAGVLTVIVSDEYCSAEDLLESWFWDEACTRPVGVCDFKPKNGDKVRATASSGSLVKDSVYTVTRVTESGIYITGGVMVDHGAWPCELFAAVDGQ